MRLVSLLVILAGTTPLAAQTAAPAPDTAGIGRLIDQAMNHSEVMQNLEYLSDRIGPRLSLVAGHAPGQRLDRRAVSRRTGSLPGWSPISSGCPGSAAPSHFGWSLPLLEP